MTMPPRLSVIVPVHNQSRLLPEAIESIWAAAAGIDCEIIVIDDGSDDATPEVAATLLSAGRITRLERRAECGGPSVARNDGIEFARGEYIGFLDADDLRLPDSFAPQLARLAAEPALGGILAQVLVERLDGSAAAPGPTTLIQLGALMVRRELFAAAAVGPFAATLRFGEDVDWMLRAREKGVRIEHSPELAVRYRRHPGSLTADLAPARGGLAAALQRSLARRRRPRVSVVIPAHNAASYLAAALSSVLGQGEPPAEIVVVDDGSTDATAEIARAHAGRGVRLLSQSRAGPAAARNAGVAASRGDWLAFLDADDLWPSERQARLAAALADPQLDGVFGAVRQFLCPSLTAIDRAAIVCPKEAQPGRLAGAMLLRRAAFERVGPFDVRFRAGEFIDWHARAVEAGLRFGQIQDVVLERRLHRTNLGRTQPDSRQQLVHAVKAALDRRRAARAQS